MAAKWGYSNKNGPETWCQYFPEAAGQRQSPINIRSIDVQRMNCKQKLKWRYQLEDTRSIINTGHSWKIEASDDESEISGGPLEGVYHLKQLHSHWGSSDNAGSEHTVDGKYYAGELHLVHWNSKYGSFEEAAKYPDGLCVFGIFLTPGCHNPEFDEIINTFDDIKYKGHKSKIRGPINLDSLIPQNNCFWTYLGSLTTPPCSECVIWIVFKEPIEVSTDQLEKFRRLRCLSEEDACPENEGHMECNFRPTLPLGDRTIKMSLE